MTSETRDFLGNGEVKLVIVRSDPQLAMQGTLYVEKAEMVVERPKWLSPGTYAFRIKERDRDIVLGEIVGLGAVTLRVRNGYTHTTSVGSLSPPLS